MINDSEHFFNVLICHSDIIFAEVSVEIFCPFTLGFLFWFWIIELLVFFMYSEYKFICLF